MMAMTPLSRLTTAVAFLAVTQSAAFAAGTEQQREACTPDAFRLCASSMPDEGRVESCLRAAGPRLSGACHAVFFPPSAANAQMVRSQPRVAPSTAQRPETPSMPQMPPGQANDDDN
jgi:hypothetical protein